MSALHHLRLLTAVLVVCVLWSGVAPTERHTWWLEIAPVLIVLPLLWWSVRRFPLTPLLYVLIGIHGAILCYGGAYTYAETPLGFWLQDLMGSSRNHYDRIGHLAQGFVPAIAAREILLRTSPLVRGRWIAFLVCCTCLACSAFYEFIEWWAAAISGEAADSFLGTQGDPWDTQWDMFLALCGAIAALLSLSRWHDVHLRKLLGAESD